MKKNLALIVSFCIAISALTAPAVWAADQVQPIQEESGQAVPEQEAPAAEEPETAPLWSIPDVPVSGMESEPEASPDTEPDADRDLDEKAETSAEPVISAAPSPEAPAALSEASTSETYAKTLVVSSAGDFKDMKSAFDSLTEDVGGKVLIQVDEDQKPASNSVLSIPADKNITELTIGTSLDSVNIGKYSGMKLYANGVPVVIGNHVTFEGTIFGGGNQPVTAGGSSITVSEGAIVTTTIYGGGDKSDVTGDVSILVNGSASGIRGGGYAYAYTDDTDVTAQANVTGNISITVEGDNSSFGGTLTGGGYAYSSSSKEGTQDLTADVDGNIEIRVDCPVIKSGAKVYGGGYADLVTPKNNRRLTADVTGGIQITYGGKTKGTSKRDRLNLWGGGYARSLINASDATVYENIQVSANVGRDIKIDATEDDNPTSLEDDWDASMFDELCGGGCAAGQHTDATVGGSTYVDTARKAAISDRGACGGGYAAQAGVARVKGDSYIRVRKAAGQPEMHENAKGVIGGGSAYTHSDATVEGNTTVIIDDGVRFENNNGVAVVGGGRVIEAYGVADVLGSATLTIGKNVTLPGGSKIVGGGSAYKGTDSSANVSGSVTMSIGEGLTTKSYIIGGGYAGTAGSTANVSGSVTTSIGESLTTNSNIIGGGYAANATSSATSGGTALTLDSVTISVPVYGGGMALANGADATVKGDTVLSLKNSTFNHYVYGGGAVNLYSSNPVIYEDALADTTGKVTMNAENSTFSFNIYATGPAVTTVGSVEVNLNKTVLKQRFYTCGTNTPSPSVTGAVALNITGAETSLAGCIWGKVDKMAISHEATFQISEDFPLYLVKDLELNGTLEFTKDLLNNQKALLTGNLSGNGKLILPAGNQMSAAGALTGTPSLQFRGDYSAGQVCLTALKEGTTGSVSFMDSGAQGLTAAVSDIPGSDPARLQWMLDTVPPVAPVIDAQPAGTLTAVKGDAGKTLTVAASATDGGALSYQWYVSAENKNEGGTPVAGATTAVFSVPTDTVGTQYYYCVVTNTLNAKTATTPSAVSVVEILPLPLAPVIDAQPAGTLTAVKGDTGKTLTVAASATDGGTLSYQWYVSAENKNEGGTPIAGATAAVFSVPTDTVGTQYYYCVVTNTLNDKTASTVSSVSVVEILPLPVAPVIGTQPAGTLTAVKGDTGKTLTVAASATDGGELSYQWYVNTENQNEGGTPVAGATTAVFSVPTDTVGTQYYYCVVTNTLNGKTATTVSSVSVIEILPLPVAPVIDAQPAGTLTAVKGDAGKTLTVAASAADGGELSYQWYVNTENKNEGGTPVAGATTAVFSVPTDTVGTQYYYCVVTNTLNAKTATTVSSVSAVTIDITPDYVEDEISKLPDPDPEQPSEEDKANILDVKKDFEELPDEDKGEIPQEQIDELHEKLTQLKEIQVEVAVETVSGQAALENKERFLEAMTGDEAAQLKDGSLSSFKIVVTIAESGSLSEAEQAELIKAAGNESLGYVYQVTAVKETVDGSGSKKTEAVPTLSSPVRVTFQIPDSIQPEKGYTRTYQMIRLHQEEDGSYTAQALENLDKGSAAITVLTDRFSKYAIVYSEKQSETSKPGKPTTKNNNRLTQELLFGQNQAAKITTAVVKSGPYAGRPLPTYLNTERTGGQVTSFEGLDYEFVDVSVSFQDVSGHWAETEINNAASRKIINGISDTQFMPDTDVTRAEFAAIVLRALGLTPKDKPAFSDVQPEAWYYGEIAAAQDYGIIDGIGGGLFAPDERITRQEAMAVLSRAAAVTNHTWTQNGSAADGFADRELLADWASSSASFCVSNGLFTGKDSQHLDPLAQITRAETVTAVIRLLQAAELID